MGDIAFFRDEELLLPWGAGELALGADGQGDHVVVFCLVVLDDLEGGTLAKRRPYSPDVSLAVRLARTRSWSSEM